MPSINRIYDKHDECSVADFVLQLHKNRGKILRRLHAGIVGDTAVAMKTKNILTLGFYLAHAGGRVGYGS